MRCSTPTAPSSASSRPRAGTGSSSVSSACTASSSHPAWTSRRSARWTSALAATTWCSRSAAPTRSRTCPSPSRPGAGCRSRVQSCACSAIKPELATDPGIRYVTSPSDAEVNELLNQATVFLQTSTHEGFCLPVLESMATGGAVVCTDAHGNRDYCVDGVNCLMPEPTPGRGGRRAAPRPRRSRPAPAPRRGRSRHRGPL